MSASKRNTYLDHGLSDESDNDAGYDSEAAEVSKADRARASKRRKLDLDHSDNEADEVKAGVHQENKAPSPLESQPPHEEPEEESTKRSPSPPTSLPPKTKQKPKEKIPGVVYLSSLPPYLKPSALRNLLEQRGFSPISRLFLAPASKHKSSSKKNSRQLYTEGWIEFASKKTARNCAESLNTQLIGGRKGGFYHDDVWNMKYLRGMAWEELMAGIREEKREEEGRRDEERRIIARDTKMFIEGVEQGRVQEGMRRKREAKRKHPKIADDADGGTANTDVDVRRTWRQNEVKGQTKEAGKNKEMMSEDVRQVLGKIF
ncbi:hypothetical protein EDD36DRAFT_469501 [Exophiala viscosa]|uniref:Pre-rRNA-processing protein ESF2 n=1 Tax=Exophiala viscosa TaxID=2486360 RepID=A0AAN6DMK5_9EURO|nr:hypothetical protein EDD36DRAFT_469501 [Exophiala viscosa]